MYGVVRHSDKFDLDDREHKRVYEQIINNPLCTLNTERIEKLRETVFDEEGKPVRSTETFWRIVVWDEKLLIT